MAATPLQAVAATFTPAPESSSSRVTQPYGYGIDFPTPSDTTGGYAAAYVPGNGAIRGTITLEGAPPGTQILVYRPGVLQKNPDLPSQFISWVIAFYPLDPPCDSPKALRDDASGWTVSKSGEPWELLPNTVDAEAGVPVVQFSPDICVVVPGHSVLKFENLPTQQGMDAVLPSVIVPGHPEGQAGWVLYPG